jgi:hypothetical protein
MTDEPERIWIDDERPIGGELHVFTDPPVKGVEQLVVGYIRADLAEAIVRAAWEKAAAEIAPHPDHDKADWTEFAWECDRQAQRIRRLADYPAEVAAIIEKAGEDRG